MSQENVEIVRRVTDVMDAEGMVAALPVSSTRPTRTSNFGRIRPGLAPLPTAASSKCGGCSWIAWTPWTSTNRPRT